MWCLGVESFGGGALKVSNPTSETQVQEKTVVFESL